MHGLLKRYISRVVLLSGILIAGNVCAESFDGKYIYTASTAYKLVTESCRSDLSSNKIVAFDTIADALSCVNSQFLPGCKLGKLPFWTMLYWYDSKGLKAKIVNTLTMKGAYYVDYNQYDPCYLYYGSMYGGSLSVLESNDQYKIRIKSLNSSSGTNIIGYAKPRSSISDDPPYLSLLVEVIDSDMNSVEGVNIALELGEIDTSITGHHDGHSLLKPASLRGSLVDEYGNESYVSSGITKQLGGGVVGYLVSYVPSNISGDVPVVAKCVSENCEQTGNAKIWVGVKELVEMDPLNPNYSLIGEVDLHLKNHYVTQRVKNILEKLAVEYKKLGNAYTIRYNDTSLIRGGIFDTLGNWTRGRHFSHTDGQQVDVRANYPFREDAIPRESYKDFQRLVIRKFKGTVLHENDGERNEHFHLNFSKDY